MQAQRIGIAGCGEAGFGELPKNARWREYADRLPKARDPK
jgi:hypothetical protein